MKYLKNSKEIKAGISKNVKLLNILTRENILPTTIKCVSEWFKYGCLNITMKFRAKLCSMKNSANSKFIMLSGSELL